MIPTSSGFYWRFGPNHHGEMIDQVVKVAPLNVNSDDLFYFEAGRVGGIYIQEEKGVEWSEVSNPPVQHYWECPTCRARVPSWLEYCPVDHLVLNGTP